MVSKLYSKRVSGFGAVAVRRDASPNPMTSSRPHPGARSRYSTSLRATPDQPKHVRVTHEARYGYASGSHGQREMSMEQFLL